MNFSPQSAALMKPFIDSFGKCEEHTPLPKRDNKLFETILISLHQDIYEANEIIFKAGCFKHEVVSKADIKQPNVTNRRFFPAHIQSYIKENQQSQLIFSCRNVGEREINIHISLFSQNEMENSIIEKYRQQVKLMYIWLSICAKYSSNTCANVLNIYIYPTPFTKVLPGNPSGILGPEHVNTAFTAACAPNGQLIIYREEEWFKVFIHETFHAYGLDFARSEFSMLKKTLFNLFPIKSDFDVYEAYTETWARIINCAFCGFNALANKKDTKSFLMNVNFCLELERMFALYQCSKILGFMGLKYQDLHTHTAHTTYLRNNLYRENTHVFAYYILTAIFLNDYKGFLLWCQKHNKVLLKFDASTENFQALGDYISRIYMVGIDKDKIKHKNNDLKNTMRMSLLHTI